MRSAASLFARLVAKGRLRHLMLVSRIAEFESLRKAADSIGLSQPAATHALAELESLLGAPLFDRHARGMHLTELGRTLIPQLRKALGYLQDCAESATSAAMGASGTVRIGAIGAALSGTIAHVLPPFCERNPDVVVEVIGVSAHSMLRALDADEFDLLLCRDPERRPEELVFVPLEPDRYAVVARAGHRLAGRARVSLDALADETWLQAPPRGLAARDFDALCQSLGIVPRFRWVTSNSVLVALAMLQAGDLVAHMPRNTARQLLDAGLLVELAVPTSFNEPMPPIGVLARPTAWSRGHAVARLLDHLAASFGLDTAAAPGGA